MKRSKKNQKQAIEKPSRKTLNLLREKLTNSSIPEQYHIIEKLSNWTKYREEVAQILLQHFQTTSSDAIRCWICYVLPRLIEPEKVYPILLNILRQTEYSPTVCFTIAKALQSIAAHIKDPLMQVLLNEKDPKIVPYCVQALSELSEVPNEIIQHLEQESDPEQKSYLCHLLWHFCPIQAVPILMKIGTDPNENRMVRFKALAALDMIIQLHHTEMEWDEIVQTMIAKLTEPDKGMDNLLKHMMVLVLGSTRTEKADQFIHHYVAQSNDTELKDFVQRFVWNERQYEIQDGRQR